MSLAGRARRIALAAAYGSGGIGLLGAGTAALLVTEARLARRWIGPITEVPPRADGLYGASYPGAPLELMMLGDSSAAGLGVHDPTQTPGALLAAGLASAARRPVRLRCVARTGAQSVHLGPQVDQALLARPDVAVLMIGGNDVTHRVRPSASVRLLDEAVRRLRGAAIEVVVGTCPDLGTIEPVAQPLRYIAQQWSRQLAAAQTIVVVEAGGRTVSLGDLLGPEFAARPRELFGPDRFHPSAAGYAAAATAMLPSVSAALGFALEPDEQAPADTAAPAAVARGVRDVA
ncbi:MAG: SGNH/GDSL hydrolase family protein, partial [Actinomycetota bacterium]|nr:SGNH/GDSL hydrolase family protein [Actinomycetota bacterium]